SYVTNWAFLAGLIALVGFGSSVKRYIASYAAQDQLELLGGVIRRAWEVTFIASVAVGLVMLASVMLFSDQMDRSLTITFIVASIGLPLTTLQSLQVSSLVAL